MTVKEVASQLGLSYQSVLMLIREKQLGCQRLGPRGRKINVTQAHLDKYRRTRESEATPVAITEYIKI